MKNAIRINGLNTTEGIQKTDRHKAGNGRSSVGILNLLKEENGVTNPEETAKVVIYGTSEDEVLFKTIDYDTGKVVVFGYITCIKEGRESEFALISY